MPADPGLRRLAAAHGVQTSYVNWQDRRVDVDPDVVVAVLGLLDVDAGSARAVRAALRSAAAAPAAPELPPALDRPALAAPPSTWGWMLQAYAARSARSWEVGDLADVAEFVRWATGTGAGTVMLSPLHALVPAAPLPESPYGASDRRHHHPLYLRIEDLAAYRGAAPALRARVDALRPRPSGADLIDIQQAWRAKQSALRLLWTDGAAEAPRDVDPALRAFATYQALAERHGPDWRSWPASLRHPGDPAVARAAAAMPDRVAFHAWVQRCCEEQLATVRKAAAGMAIGVVHDLAVGIDPSGADAWRLQDLVAPGARLGVPPDAFSPQGQDWGLAALRPDRLAATGYAAFREAVRGTLRHADAIRLDHAAGLWRMWWLPPGATPEQGTYVRYHPETMLRVLGDEAVQAGATVICEDLGTIEPSMTCAIRDHNMLSWSVMWLNRDAGGDFRPPATWPEPAVATLSTHDLPTIPGALCGAHVHAAERAGVLRRPRDAELAAAADRARLLDRLATEGLADAAATDEELVAATHRLLARTPSRVLLASPADVLGERRQANISGTGAEQYPNWRIPLPLPVDELVRDPRMRHVAGVLSAARPPGRVAVFLDRDGTLTHPRHYPSKPADLVLYDDVVPLLRRLQRRGVLLLVVTNQSGIARGLFSEQQFTVAQTDLERRLAELGVRFDGVYHCPHHVDGAVAALAVRCACRKPEPGMLLRAAAEHGVDLRRSWMIGDTPADVAAGLRAGCRSVLVRHEPAAERGAAGGIVAAGTAQALGHVLRELEAADAARGVG